MGQKKRDSNLEKHGIDFHDAPAFFESDLLCFESDRQDYVEKMLVAFGQLAGRLIVTAYTLRNESIRILSMHKASDRERRLYEQYIKDRLG
ncbi:BrnT family toxin [Desulfonatronospira sp.]|uniref:BrnT family toxin n=1 Tax=Desulfonatronospira sp. TaxID=1962951 RepID=UPI00343C24C6